MVQTQCPVCHEVGGFHNRETHESRMLPAESRLPSGWLKTWQEEEKTRLAESVSDLSGITVESVVEEAKTVTIKYDTFIALVAAALDYNTRLPYGACPREVAVLLPEGWLDKYYGGLT